MKRRTGWVRGVILQIERHLGPVVISFSLGVLFAAWIGRDEAWVQFWTILTAVAALISAVASLRPQKPAQVLVNEYSGAARVDSTQNAPVFRVARMRGIGPIGANLVFANAGSAPVLVTEVHVYDDQEHRPHPAHGGFMIPSGGEKAQTIPFDVSPLEGGAILVYFRYGPTGETPHRLYLPYETKTVRHRNEDGSVESHERVSFLTDSQHIDSGEEVERELAETRTFWRENPLRVVDIRPATGKRSSGS